MQKSHNFDTLAAAGTRTIAEIAEDMLAKIDEGSDFMMLAGASLIVAESRGEHEAPGEKPWHDREEYTRALHEIFAIRAREQAQERELARRNTQRIFAEIARKIREQDERDHEYNEARAELRAEQREERRAERKFS